jgi:hypothetical protein
MKLLHNEVYKDITFQIHGKYIKDHFDWEEGFTNAVELNYKVTNLDGKDLYIERFQFAIVPEKKPRRYFFKTYYPKTTFEEDVREKINKLINYIKGKIDDYLFKKEMTDGLLESLRK